MEQNKDRGVLFYWLMLKCMNWKGCLVVFRTRGWILLNLNRESRLRSVQQGQEPGQHLSVCLEAEGKREYFETWKKIRKYFSTLPFDIRKRTAWCEFPQVSPASSFGKTSIQVKMNTEHFRSLKYGFVHTNWSYVSQTHCFSITKNSQLDVFRKMIAFTVTVIWRT